MEHETGPAEAGRPDAGSQSSPDETGRPAGASVAPEPGRGAGPGTVDLSTGGLSTGELSTGELSTGEPRVDAALQLLDRLPGLPVSEHPELFEQVHAQLTEVLGELDSGPGGPVGQHAN